MKIHRVRLEKNKNHRNLITSCENQPNLENHRIPFENQKNYENHRIPKANNKVMKILEFHSIISKTKKKL